MRPYSFTASALGAAVCLTLASPAPAAEATTLPLKRVRLYEAGVAYFERTGKLQGAKAALPVPAGHLDDALKTLVLLSKGGAAQVSGIEFDSSVSRNMARALAGIGTASGQASKKVDYRTLLGSLKGAQVEIAHGRAKHKGRLIDVAHSMGPQRCTERGGGKRVCKREPATHLLLVTKTSEIRRFDAKDVQSVKALDPAFKARLGAALDALGHSGAKSRRKLEVHAAAGKDVTLGYVAETPVWRSTYRLVLDAKEPTGLLQGWALLHNDTDEHWKKVKVELVNGRPDSFLFPLAAPRYARRKLVTPERELSTVPQLMGKTVDNMWTPSGAMGLGLSGTGEGGGGVGYGVGLGSIGTLGHGSGRLRAGQSSILSVGNLAGVAGAEGVEAGALFRYALAKPIDLRAHGSALLPFAKVKVKATRIAYFEHLGAKARSAVHLVNDGRQTLPPGPISVFSDGGFSGESALSRTKSGEHRILSYGYDLDVELDQKKAEHADKPRLLEYRRGQLVVHFLRTHTIDYEVTNRSGAAREVYYALPFVNNARVSGATRLAFDQEAKRPLAVLASAAKSVTKHRLEVVEGRRRHIKASRLGAQQVRALAAEEGLPAAQRTILREAAADFDRQQQRNQAITKTRAALGEAQSDVERLRKHVAALGSRRGEGGKKLVERLLAREDDILTARKRIGRLEKLAEASGEAALRTLAKLGRPTSKR